MGWFLSSSKKKSKSKAKRSASVDPKWDPKRTLLGVKFAAAGGAVVAIAMGWHFGTQQLEASVRAHSTHPISSQDIHFSETPELISPGKINELRTELAGVIGDDPLNRRGLEQAAEILESRQDLIRQVRQVRRTPQGTIEIDLSFRTPAAIVLMRNPLTGELSDDGFHVIDNQGYHMFGLWEDIDRSQHDLPLILGVSSNNRPQENQHDYRWQDSETHAALTLINTLKNTPALDHIESISVDETDERGRIRLVINTLVIPPGAVEPVFCRIVWGLPPGEERTIEPDTDRKIEALITLLGNGNYRTGHWREVWINTGNIQLPQAIGER